MTCLTHRWLADGISGITLLLVVVAIVRSRSVDPTDVAGIAFIATFAVVGWILWRRLPGNPIGSARAKPLTAPQRRRRPHLRSSRRVLPPIGGGDVAQRPFEVDAVPLSATSSPHRAPDQTASRMSMR